MVMIQVIRTKEKIPKKALSRLLNLDTKQHETIKTFEPKKGVVTPAKSRY